jgi:glycosyltransferase involved in cell wall biosynthesis
VSIVTATYNRSNVLRFAIDSVLSQSMPDWELIVVGDACTDDTAAVVGAFDDARIRFVNLPANTGEQSGPNNEGVRLARGRYIAFLNHDDRWLPHHLAALTSHLETQPDSDLAFALTCFVQPDGSGVLGGATPDGRYVPWMGLPASSWMVRRALVDRIGPWRHYRQCYRPPSQDWLHRAHRAGAVLVAVPTVSVFAIQSATRARSYVDRHDHEHARLAERLQDDAGFALRQITALAVDTATLDPRYGTSLAVRPYVSRAIKNLGRRCLLAVGLDPMTVRAALRLRKGAVIDQYRRVRGLARHP